jgi:predicted GTPase
MGVLGGTGVGKSALVNALVGTEVVETGKSRPTTGRPILVCCPDLTPELLGIDPANVEVVHRDLPSLANLVVVDCPDPDTTEAADAPGTNLARLRQILPHCDVILVATTQQKYRSARVAEELAVAAAGARLVFVQTHADVNEDIRDDWRQVLDARYASAHVFLIDSLSALADAQNGLEPRGEFAALVDLLTRQLVGSAAARIRRANLLDLVEQTLSACSRRIDEALPAVRQLDEAILQQRSRLAARLAQEMRSELITSRRQWENRLLGEVLSRWGFSPFSLVLRLYHGIGGLVVRGLVLRARTPAQMALWGAVEGVRSWQAFRRRRRAETSAAQAVAGCWDEAELRSAALVIDGYATEAGIDRDASRAETVFQEAAGAATSVADNLATELQSLLSRAAQRHTGWLTRYRYDFLFLIVLVGLFFRPAKNFFYDSWLASPPVPMMGVEAYLLSAFWLVVWSGLLLWGFTSRLRRGLQREIDRLAEGWATPRLAQEIFGRLEAECRAIDRFRQDLARLEQQVATLRRRIAQPSEPLGHRR